MHLSLSFLICGMPYFQEFSVHEDQKAGNYVDLTADYYADADEGLGTARETQGQGTSRSQKPEETQQKGN